MTRTDSAHIDTSGEISYGVGISSHASTGKPHVNRYGESLIQVQEGGQKSERGETRIVYQISFKFYFLLL